MTTAVVDPYEPRPIRTASGGRVFVAPGRDGEITLLTQLPSGIPGTTLLAQDDLRALIEMLEGMVEA